MYFENIPFDFKSGIEVVSCFLENAGQILLLHRQDNKPQGDTWGVPAGKINLGESRIEAVIREIQEETGTVLTDNDLEYLGKVYVRYPSFDFVYHMHRSILGFKPCVQLNPSEHKDFAWVFPDVALTYKLIMDESSCIKKIYDL